MKYCITYAKNFRHLNEVDEIILPYQGSEELITFIPELVKDNFTQRILLNILSLPAEQIPAIIPYINKLRKDNYNIGVITKISSQIEEFKQEGIPFFFMKGASNLEEAVVQAEAGASDIYVVEELGFRIKDLEYLKTHYNVQLRVYPNIAQSAANSIINGLERFWIRPEDTEIYEPYIDVFEIVSGDNTSRLSVVYEIYRNRKWLGNLNDIILDFKEPIVNNRGMNPHFAEMRLNCGKKCLLGKCNLCSQMGNMANSFVEVGLEVVKKKYKPKRTKEEQEAIINSLKERAHELGIDENINDVK